MFRLRRSAASLRSPENEVYNPRTDNRQDCHCRDFKEQHHSITNNPNWSNPVAAGEEGSGGDGSTWFGHRQFISFVLYSVDVQKYVAEMEWLFAKTLFLRIFQGE
jgi:hypothetical protein